MKHPVNKRSSGKNLKYTLLNNTMPPTVVELYKTLRTNLMFMLEASVGNIVVVTSPNPGEGKSTVCANLALAVSEYPKKVLLLDANLRNPVQHRIFGLPNDKGFVSITDGVLLDYNKLIEEDKKVSPHLAVLTSGPPTQNPSEFLSSPHTANTLKTLSESFDFIFIDTPPVNTVTDSAVLSVKAAGVLMVACYGKTTYDDIEKAVNSLEYVGANLLGVVINRVKSR